MSNSENTLVVSEEDVLEAAWRQFKESSAGSHPLVIRDGELVYEAHSSGGYYDSDKISAYDVGIGIDFDPDQADKGRDFALQNFDGIKNEVEIGGEVYQLTTAW